ncbi:hypothetical protein QQG55_48950 [Brugia pahangi]
MQHWCFAKSSKGSKGSKITYGKLAKREKEMILIKRKLLRENDNKSKDKTCEYENQHCFKKIQGARTKT